MTFNVGKWLPLIIKGMSIVEKISNAKGKDKLNAVIDNLSDELGLIEATTDKELLNDEDVKKAVATVVTSIKTLENLVKSKKAK